MTSLELFCYDILELIALHGGPEVFALLRRVNKHFANETKDPELLIKFKNYYTKTIKNVEALEVNYNITRKYTISTLCGKLHSKINKKGESLPAILKYNAIKSEYWFKHGVPWRENNKPHCVTTYFNSRNECWYHRDYKKIKKQGLTSGNVEFVNYYNNINDSIMQTKKLTDDIQEITVCLKGHCEFEKLYVSDNKILENYLNQKCMFHTGNMELIFKEYYHNGKLHRRYNYNKKGHCYLIEKFE